MDESLDGGVVLSLVRGTSQQDVYFGEIHVVGYSTETVHPFGEGVAVFLGEGPGISRRFVTESLGRVVVEGGLRGMRARGDGRRCEPRWQQGAGRRSRGGPPVQQWLGRHPRV